MTVPATNPEPARETFEQARDYLFSECDREDDDSMEPTAPTRVADVGFVGEVTDVEMLPPRPVVHATGEPAPTMSEARASIEGIVASALAGGPADVVDALTAEGRLYWGPMVPDDPDTLTGRLAATRAAKAAEARDEMTGSTRPGDRMNESSVHGTADGDRAAAGDVRALLRCLAATDDALPILRNVLFRDEVAALAARDAEVRRATDLAAACGYDLGLGESVHAPQVEKRDDGTWGVICAACSRIAQDYVYPCREGRGEWPPAVLTDAAEVRQLRDQLARVKALCREADAQAFCNAEPTPQWATDVHNALTDGEATFLTAEYADGVREDRLTEENRG